MYTSVEENVIYNIITGYGYANIIGIEDTKDSSIGSGIVDLKCTDIIPNVIVIKFTGSGVCWEIDGKVNNSEKACRWVIIIITGCGAIGMLRSFFYLYCAMWVFRAKSFIFKSLSSFYSGILKHSTKAAKLPLTTLLTWHIKMPLFIRWDCKKCLKSNSNATKYSIFYLAKSSWKIVNNSFLV